MLITDLPTDIIYQLLCLINYSSLINIMQTNKHMYKLMDEKFWQHIYQRHYNKKISRNARVSYSRIGKLYMYNIVSNAYDYELMESEIVLPFKIVRAEFIEANKIFLTDVNSAKYTLWLNSYAVLSRCGYLKERRDYHLESGFNTTPSGSIMYNFSSHYSDCIYFGIFGDYSGNVVDSIYLCWNNKKRLYIKMSDYESGHPYWLATRARYYRLISSVPGQGLSDKMQSLYRHFGVKYYSTEIFPAVIVMT